MTASLRGALAAGLLLLTSGCYRATIRSGLPPGEAAPGWNERWTSAWLLGAVERPLPSVDALCPGGFAQTDSRVQLGQGLVAVATLGIYSPHATTVVCAAPHAGARRPLHPTALPTDPNRYPPPADESPEPR